MMLTSWVAIAWFILRGADEVRPTALQRTYSLLWIYIGAYLALVVVTVLEKNFGLAGPYFMVIYFAAVFISLLISYIELFALPTKSMFAHLVSSGGLDSSTPHMTASVTSSRPLTASHDEQEHHSFRRHSEDDDATERTSLLRGDRTTFAGGYGGRGRSADE